MAQSLFLSAPAGGVSAVLVSALWSAGLIQPVEWSRYPARFVISVSAQLGQHDSVNHHRIPEIL